ncbi:MAG: hypothetical protein K2X48_01390 [Chitinophagaceae bacterium]|nr:hypothetical protein [Chitinophagaceae bacterium]
MNTKRFYLPLLGLFVAALSLTNLFRNFIEQKGIDADVVSVGNIILFLVFIASLYFHITGFLHKNVQVFLRSVYGSLLVKMFVCAIAAAVYILVAKKNVNKAGLFICMGLYILYTIVEIRQVFRLLKEKKQS